MYLRRGDTCHVGTLTEVSPRHRFYCNMQASSDCCIAGIINRVSSVQWSLLYNNSSSSLLAFGLSAHIMICARFTLLNSINLLKSLLLMNGQLTNPYHQYMWTVIKHQLQWIDLLTHPHINGDNMEYIQITHTANRKSYLVISGPISHEQLTKYESYYSPPHWFYPSIFCPNIPLLPKCKLIYPYLPVFTPTYFTPFGHI